MSVFVAAVLGLGGCASEARSPPASESGEHECALRLPLRPSATTRPAVQLPVPVAPQSQLVVHAEMPLAPLKQRLEARVPQRLAEGRVRIGPGGTVSYRVDRGELSLNVTQTALLIAAPVHARAEACRGEACYASCEPEAVVRIEIPLLLRPDYRFAKSEANLRFTRGCEVRALGGLLTLDVTPTLAAALEPELDEVARQVDEQLPAVRSHIEQGWSELAQVRSLPLGGCFVLQPVALVQGPFVVSSQKLAARFAVIANPELRASCGDTAPSVPLPLLRSDLALPNEGVVRLGMVTPLAGLERAFESAPPMQVSGKRLGVAHAELRSDGGAVDAELALTGEVCGNVALKAGLDFSGDGQFVRLTHAQLAAGEQQRLGNSLEPGELPRTLAAPARVAPLLSVSAFRDTAPSLAAGLSQPTFDVSATVASVSAAGATARGDQLVAWLEAHGAIWLSQKQAADLSP